MDRDTFDSLMVGVDPSMIVVTASDGDDRAGCLVGFHTQSSIEPRRYAIWLSKENHTYDIALRARHLAVHVLTAQDRALAERFGGETGDEVDKFAGIDWEPGPDGVPLLTACPNRLVVRRVAMLDEGGDHLCIVTEPVDAATTGSFEPMRFQSVEDIDPGHPPE